MMYEIHMTVDKVFLKRTATGDFLPRVGEYVNIGVGGWNERVEAVWHTPNDGLVKGRTVVEIGRSQGIVDGLGEGLLQKAIDAGWQR